MIEHLTFELGCSNSKKSVEMRSKTAGFYSRTQENAVVNHTFEYMR